ncbi:MAG: YraN family protein [Clostridia bacterium]|nr:YraN family protein [Clostridia bacterium]
MHNKELGAKGEKKARRYLFLHGWKIIAKNYKTPFGEIDIIARKKDVLAFIEVKTRLSDIFGLPSEAVDERRKRRYIMGANYFLANKNADLTIRFDIIEIFRGQLNHIENAFF